jgi:hypothetical protein
MGPVTRSRRFLHAAGLAALAAMLFAQAAFALAACDPVKAMSRAHMIAAQQAEPAPCHAPVDNGVLCLAHCQAGEQTLDKHQVKVPDASLGAVLLVRAWPEVGRSPGPILRGPSPAADPPPRILFRTLLL